MSSETSEWVVVNSKSRLKKEGFDNLLHIKQGPDPALKSGPSKSNSNKSTQIFQNRSTASNFRTKPGDKGQSRPSHRPSASGRKPFKTGGGNPNGPNQKLGSSTNQNDPRTLVDKVLGKISQAAPDTSVSQSASLTQTSVPLTPGPTSCPVTPSPQAPSSSTQEASSAAPKKKRTGNKEARRKKREEKFYQALYQNKDSHIHFVSPDVIRQLQNPQPKAKPAPRRELVTSNDDSLPSPAPIRAFDEFPSLSLGGSKISYSSVAAHPPPSNRVLDSNVPTTSQAAETPAPPPPVAPPAPKGKKSLQPMVIDVSALIVTKQRDKESRKTAKLHSLRENVKVTTGNQLDSSGPGLISRGKIRVKKKRPTKLKLSVLKSRALRKSLLAQESNEGSPPGIAGETEEKIEPHLPFDVVKAEPVEDAQIDTEQEEKVEDGETNVKAEEDTNVYAKLLNQVSKLTVKDELASESVAFVKAAMHNRKFRDYCDMYTSKELFHFVMQYLTELFRFQDRLYHTDPIKFKIKRRFVQGIKEALSYLSLNKVQLLIIAADIERNPEPGGLDEKVAQIIALAKGNNVPYLFCGSKYNLGKPIRIKTPVCVISVLNGQSCEDKYQIMMEEVDKLRERYKDDFQQKLKEKPQN